MRDTAKRCGNRARSTFLRLLVRLESVYKLLVTNRRWFAVTSAAVEDFWSKKIHYFTGNFTYNALLAVLALVVALSALVGLLAASSSFSREASTVLKSLVPVFGSGPDQTLDILKTYRGVVGIIGLVGLVWTGTRIFGAVELGFCQIWGSGRRGYARSKVLGAVMVSVVGLLFLTAFLVQFAFAALWAWMVGSTGALHRVGVVLAQPLVGFGVNFGLFLFVYKVIPTVRQRFRTILLGAGVSAAVYLGMQYLLAWYFSSVSRMPAVYGSLSTVVILVVWLHLTGFVVFFGEELIYVTQNRGLVTEHLERARSWSFVPASWGSHAPDGQPAEEEAS